MCRGLMDFPSSSGTLSDSHSTEGGTSLFRLLGKRVLWSMAPQKTKVYLDAQLDRFRSGGLPGAILPDADGTSKFAKLLQSIHLL